MPVSADLGGAADQGEFRVRLSSAQLVHDRMGVLDREAGIAGGEPANELPPASERVRAAEVAGGKVAQLVQRDPGGH